MKGAKGFPGLQPPTLTDDYADRMLRWLQNELRAESRWPWYRAIKPLRWVYQTRPSEN